MAGKLKLRKSKFVTIIFQYTQVYSCKYIQAQKIDGTYTLKYWCYIYYA